MSKPPQTLKNDQAGYLSIRRVRSASIGNSHLGLAYWLDEFDQALSQQDYACCQALLAEIRQEGYQLSTNEQAWIESRRAALLLCQGIYYHRLGEYDRARQYYEASRALYQTLDDESGSGQAIIALEELEKQGAGTDNALLERLAANPRALGNSSRLLKERLETLPVAEQILVITAAKQSGHAIPLLAGLSSPDPVVQAAAATALTWLKPGPDYGTVIKAMLASSNWLIRWQAIGILHRRFDKEAEEFAQHLDQIHRVLVQRLEDGESDPMIRRNIALLLLKLKDAADTSTLINLLADPDSDVRYAAIKALAALGDGRALPILRLVQHGRDFSGNSISEAVKTAIRHIKQRFPVPVFEVVLCHEITAQEQPVQPTSPFSVQHPPRYCAVTISYLTSTILMNCSIRAQQRTIFRLERLLKPGFTLPEQEQKHTQEPLLTLPEQEQKYAAFHQEPTRSDPSQEQGAAASGEEEMLIIPSQEGVHLQEEEEEEEEEGEELLIELMGDPERSDLDFIRQKLYHLFNELLNVEALLALVEEVTEEVQGQIDQRARELLIVAKELMTDTRDLIEARGEEFLEIIQPLTDILQQVFDEHEEEIMATLQVVRELYERFGEHNRREYLQSVQNFFRQLIEDHGEEILAAVQPQIDTLRRLFTSHSEQFLDAIQPLIAPARALIDECREILVIVIRPLTSFLQNFYEQYKDELLFLWEVLQEIMRPLVEQMQRNRGNYLQNQEMVYEFINEWREEVIAIAQPMIESVGDLIDQHEEAFSAIIAPLITTVRTLIEEHREEFTVAATALADTGRDLIHAHEEDFSGMAAPLTQLIEHLERSPMRRSTRVRDEKETEQQLTHILFTFPTTEGIWSPGEYSVEVALNGAIGARQAFKIVSD
jgi:HEAT repeat protein